MDGQQFEELLSRWTAGDRLAPAEQQQLLDWLESHADARHALLEDEKLDTLLRCLRRLDDTADEFVERCANRLAVDRANRRVPAAAVLPPPIVASPAPSRRALLEHRAVKWMAAVAACCAAMVLGLIGWRWLAREHQFGNANQVAKRPAIMENPRLEPRGAFATLACSTSATWDRIRADGDRLAAGALKLTAGTAELHFDKGTIVRLTSPIVLELKNADLMLLKSGSLSATVPPPAVGFAVATPLARVTDLGTEFDVGVQDSGTTQTLVRRGRVRFQGRRGNEDVGAPIELAAGALDRASASVPDVAGAVLPIVTTAHGQGQFVGRVTAQGKTAEFHSRAAFRAFRAQVVRELRESPEQFGQNWPRLAEAASDIPSITTFKRHESPPATVPAGGENNGHQIAASGPGAEPQTVEAEENGKKVSITDSKDAGITVTITESEGGKKKTTKVHAADMAELAKKNPEAHRFYRKYFHPHPKNGKPK